jgi:Predicted metal-binding integral membrane protein (DUF2182)
MWLRALLRVALRGPGKALLLASAGGWIALAYLLTVDPLPHSAVTVGDGEHAVVATATRMSHSPGDFMAMWLAMIVAMTPSLLLREVGRLWRTSLRRLRYLTIASFLCGYVGVWLLPTVALPTLFGWVTVSSERIAATIALVVVWYCSPARQRCLNRCHTVPALRVFGTVAQWDSLRYGISTGCYCAAACGLVMFVVLLANDYHFALMAVTAALTTFERYLPARRPSWQLPVFRSASPDWPDMAVAMRSAGAGRR